MGKTMMSPLCSPRCARVALIVVVVSVAYVVCREDVASPVRPGEKSSRGWEKAAKIQEEEDEERAKVREMGGSDTAIVNILDGDISTGKIHPVGDRTAGIAVANLTQMATDFLSKINRKDDTLAHEKMVYWLNQGAGHLCDACKFMIEEMQRTILVLANEKIKARDTEGKNFQGGAGHQIKMDEEMKAKVRKSCDNPNYHTANIDMRKWCQTTMDGNHSTAVVNSLMQGSFGLEDLLARQDGVCGNLVKVCPAKPKQGHAMTPCRACAEAFQDLDQLLQRDRRDIDVGTLGIKAHQQRKASDRRFRGRQHVYQKSQDLCSSVNNRHPTGAATVIQEVCEEIMEEHEDDVVRAFVQGSIGAPGASAQEVCVNIADKCTAEEFESVRTSLASYHMPPHPFTQQLGDAPPTHTEL